MDVTRPRATKASQITWDLAATLIASLENGGVNEISVAGLGGVLADTQIPSAHKTIHQDGGSDEIGLAGLSGIGLADLPQITTKYEASEDLLHAHDAEASTSSGTYAKLKTITITDLFLTPSTIRIKWQDKSPDGAGQGHLKVYKNGAAYGSKQDTGSVNWLLSSTENLSFAKNDLIQVYAFADAGSVYIKELRIYGKPVDVTYHEARDENRLGLAIPFTGTNS